MAKVSTHGRATPVLERSWKEEEEGRAISTASSILLTRPRRYMSPRYIRWNE